MIRLRLLLALWPLAVTAQERYDAVLNQLSEPVETRWKQLGTPYFSTNEKLLNLFYPAFENAGGVVVGVSFQQNLSLLVHARPELSVIFDINPGMTEIVVPFFGKLLERSATRREFVAILLGVDVTAEQTVKLLEQPTEQLPATLGEIFEHASEGERKKRVEVLRAVMRDEVLAGLPAAVNAAMRARALSWIDLLEEQEILPGMFFRDATEAYSLSTNRAEQRRLAGWLSNEDNYRTVRRYWTEGRIVGVTGDISGASVMKLGQWIRENRTIHRREVTGIYLSNVGASVDGHFAMSWFQHLYAQLATLPLAPGAMTLMAQGPWRLTAFAEPFSVAKWAHDALSDVPESMAIQLHEAPLEAGVQLGRPSVLVSLRQRLAQGDLKASGCLDLIRKIEEDPGAVQFLSGDEFATWAKQAVPGLDVKAAEFRTVAVTLVEAGYLGQVQVHTGQLHPSPESRGGIFGR